MIKVVYIGGPYRGPNNWVIACNVHRAAELALEVWKAGFAAVCPHLNTADFQGAAEDSVWLDGDLAIMKKCDAVLMTPDWKRSTGATAEHDEALKVGLPVYYSVEELINAERTGD